RRLSEDTVTLETLGKQLGISKERVRQIEHQALGKLRKALEAMVGDPEKAGLIPDL
ncbi:MAG: sigma factor-like helix-turn-helix DNA-binding protein, partial [Pseudomonadota bacterium]